jgi:hypothetical protein
MPFAGTRILLYGSHCCITIHKPNILNRNIEKASTETGGSDRQEPHRKRTNINKAVISRLENPATLQSRIDWLFEDVDTLAGSWSKKEAAVFEMPWRRSGQLS